MMTSTCVSIRKQRALGSVALVIAAAIAFVTTSSVFADGAPFEVTVAGETTGYSTLTAAAQAVNAAAGNSECILAVTQDATYSEPVSFMRAVTIKSTGTERPYVLRRTSADALIAFGSNVWTHASNDAAYSVVVTNLTIDGGADWLDDDPCSFEQGVNGVGAGGLIFMNATKNKQVTLVLENGTTLQNVRMFSASANDIPGNGYVLPNPAIMVGANSNLDMRKGSRVTRCRGSQCSAIHLNSYSYRFDFCGEIDHCSMTNTTASYGCGGAISVREGTMYIIGGSIHHNYGYYGGAISMPKGGIVNMTGGEITGNHATRGGAIYREYTQYYGTGYFSGGYITNNVATTQGGGVWQQSSGTGYMRISGSIVVRDNYVDNGSTVTENNWYVHNDNAKQWIIGPLTDAAYIGVTYQTNPTDGTSAGYNQYAVPASAKAYDFKAIHYDNTSLVVGLDGDNNPVWVADPYDGAGVATLEIDGTETPCESLTAAFIAANESGKAATVTLNSGTTLGEAIPVSGDVTFKVKDENCPVVFDGNPFAMMPGCKLTLSGANINLDLSITVPTGCTLAFADDCEVAITGTITIENGAILEVAGAPSVAGLIYQADKRQIVLAGPLTSDLRISAPVEGSYLGWEFGTVKAGYSATAADAAHFIYDRAADVSGVVSGSDVKWPSAAEPVARIGGTEYTSVEEAVDAANANNGTAEVVFLKNATFTAPLAITNSMVFRASGNTPFALTAKDAGALMTIGSPDREVTLSVTNLVFDGGAIWTDPNDIKNLANDGIVASGSFITVTGGKTAVLELGDGAGVRNVEVPYLAAAVMVNAKGTIQIDAGAKISDCRGSEGAPTIRCNGTGALFKMTGGEICRCSHLKEYVNNHIYGVINLYSCSGDCLLSGGIVHGNYSQRGAFSLQCQFTMTGGTVTGNSGVEAGGMYRHYTSGYQNSYLYGGYITNNVAEKNAGGYYNGSGSSAENFRAQLAGDIVIRDNWIVKNDVRTPADLLDYPSSPNKSWVKICGPLGPNASVGLVKPANPATLEAIEGYKFAVQGRMYDKGANPLYTITASDAGKLFYNGSPIGRKQIVAKSFDHGESLCWTVRRNGFVVIVR